MGFEKWRKTRVPNMSKAASRGGATGANALAAFHHAVSRGDLPKVKAFVEGTEAKPSNRRIAVNTQDEDGLAAVHWAAMKGYRDILAYLYEKANADTTLLDKDGWSPLMWAIFCAEQAQKETGKRKSQYDVINYLVKIPAVQEQLIKSDRLLCKTPMNIAVELARMTDEAVMAAIKGTWEPNKAYGPFKEEAVDDRDKRPLRIR